MTSDRLDWTPDPCSAARDEKPDSASAEPRARRPDHGDAPAQRRESREREEHASTDERSRATALSTASVAPPPPGDIIALSPNVVAVKHWDRLLGGLLYAVQPRVDWATLLRRSFAVDVLECPKCHGRLRVIAVITEREPVQRILAHLSMPTDPPTVARARDPTDDAIDEESTQLSLAIA